VRSQTGMGTGAPVEGPLCNPQAVIHPMSKKLNTISDFNLPFGGGGGVFGFGGGDGGFGFGFGGGFYKKYKQVITHLIIKIKQLGSPIPSNIRL